MEDKDVQTTEEKGVSDMDTKELNATIDKACERIVDSLPDDIDPRIAISALMRLAAVGIAGEGNPLLAVAQFAKELDVAQSRHAMGMLQQVLLATMPADKMAQC